MNDLSAFKPKTDTVVVELVNPINSEPLLNPDGTPMSITVYGSHSSVYQQVQDEIADKRIAKSFASGKVQDPAKSLPKTGDIREQTLDILVKTTITWNITMNKKPVDFNPETVRAIYTDFRFIREQVEEKASDFEAFLGN